MEDVVLVPEAAKSLGMSRQTLWRHINRGHLPARKVGRDYVIKVKDLAAFEAERQKTPGRPPKTVEYSIRPERVLRAVAERQSPYDA